MNNFEKYIKKIEEIDAKIAKLQEEKIASFDLMANEQLEYFEAIEKERQENDKKILADAKIEFEKTNVKKEDTKEPIEAEVNEIDFTKMSEKDIVAYGTTIGADVDLKYSKKKNIENINKIK